MQFHVADDCVIRGDDLLAVFVQFDPEVGIRILLARNGSPASALAGDTLEPRLRDRAEYRRADDRQAEVTMNDRRRRRAVVVGDGDRLPVERKRLGAVAVSLDRHDRIHMRIRVDQLVKLNQVLIEPHAVAVEEDQVLGPKFQRIFDCQRDALLPIRCPARHNGQAKASGSLHQAVVRFREADAIIARDNSRRVQCERLRHCVSFRCV